MKLKKNLRKGDRSQHQIKKINNPKSMYMKFLKTKRDESNNNKRVISRKMKKNIKIICKIKKTKYYFYSTLKPHL